MSKYFYFLLFTVSCFFSSFVMADIFDDGEDDEEELVIRESTPSSNRVIIYENMQVPDETRQERERVQVMERPPMQVYGAPLTPAPPSQSDRIGSKRKQMEQHTEQVLRNRLELLRLKDEQKRLDQLVGPMEQPDVVSSGANKVEPKKEDSSFLNLRSRYISPNPYYAFFGMGQVTFSQSNNSSYYPSITPVTNNVYALSSAFVGGLGMYEGSRVSFEYVFSRSKHQWEYVSPQTQEEWFVMYIHNAVLKYALFPGRLKPYVGVVGSLNQMFAFVKNVREINRYTALFAGLTAGVDLFLGSIFILNGGLTYLMNTYQFKYDYYNHLHVPLVDYSADKMNRLTIAATIKFMF